MVSFLHLGDIHLGYRQYKLAEREKDFMRAFASICQKQALVILHKMAKVILVFCAALAMIVSLSQGLSYRPPTKDDCLCQCDPYVSYQQYGSPQGNCRRY